MSSCSWCTFELRNLKGYVIYNSSGMSLNYTFCSLNCAVAQIQAMDVDVYNRIDHLLNIYKIRGYISPALPSSRLMKFGGKMTYEEYRRHFTCPNEPAPVEYKSSQDVQASFYYNEEAEDEEMEENHHYSDFNADMDERE